MYYNEATLALLRHSTVDTPHALATSCIEHMAAVLRCQMSLGRRFSERAAALAAAPTSATLSAQLVALMSDDELRQLANASLQQQVGALADLSGRLIAWSSESARSAQALGADILERTEKITPPQGDAALHLLQTAVKASGETIQALAGAATREVEASLAELGMHKDRGV